MGWPVPSCCPPLLTPALSPRVQDELSVINNQSSMTQNELAKEREQLRKLSTDAQDLTYKKQGETQHLWAMLLCT